MFSFTKRKAQNEVVGVLRRIVDRTTPNLTLLDGASRHQNRHNRTLPVLLTPRRGQATLLGETVIGLTKDISDHGLAMILTEPLADQDVAVTLWLATRQSPDSEPVALLGRTRHCMEIGGGFWQIGIELTERLGEQDVFDQLVSLAGQLLPAAGQLAATQSE